VFLCCVLALLVLPAPAGWSGDTPADLAAAQKHFDDGNFARAAEGLAAWLAQQDDPSSPEAVDVLIQRARCHEMLSEYDSALADLRGPLDGGSLPPLQAAQVEEALGDLSFRLPWGAYLVDGEPSYDPDHHEGEWVSREADNCLDGTMHLERAKLILDGELRAGGDSEIVDRVIELDLRLARQHQTQTCYLDSPGRPPHPAADLPPGATYDPRWPAFHRVMALYAEVETLDRGRPYTDMSTAARARYEAALALHQHMHDPEPTGLHPDILPLPTWGATDGLDALDRLIADYPSDVETDLHRYTHAALVEERGEFVAAEKEAVAFLEAYPDSAWAGDARNLLQTLRHPQLSVTTVNVIPPGGGVEVPVQARNLDSVRFTAYRVDLEAVLGNGARLRNPDVSFDDFQRNFGGIVGVRKHYIERIAAWDLPVPDAGDHAYHHLTTTLPLADVGSYVVEATGGRHDVAFLVMVSDVSVIVRQDDASALIFAADALTGEPLDDFPLIIKETYWDYTGRGRYRTELLQAYTDDDGTYRYALTGGDVSSNSVGVLAIEGDRMAVTPQMWVGSYGYYGVDEQTKVFSYTDRPVYRPGQTVHFKHLMRVQRGGMYENLPGRVVRVTVFDPQGEEIHTEELTTSEFGTLHGQLTLGEEPPLGVYSFILEFPDDDSWIPLSSGSQFRVEEYRKPEFEVTVAAAAAEARPGAEVPVDITAAYYFGAPVSDARVTYRVFRTPYDHHFRRPGPFDWLYGAGYGTIHEQPYAPGQELVEEGELTTDAEGRAQLLLAPPADEELDFAYDVQVEVTDLARRTIHGAGQVMVTRQPFFAAVDARRGFFSPGDRIELEVRAETAGRAPVSAEGALRVHRVEIGEDDGEEMLTLLSETPLRLDDGGLGWVDFVPDESGVYRAEFVAPTGEAGDVTATRELWVYDDQFPGRRVRFANLELITEKRTYRTGETLRLMVQSPFEDPTVLLSFDGASEVIDHQVLRIPGRSAVVEVELDAPHVPNFFARAAMAHDYQVFYADREIFVPPLEQLLQVSVEGDREEYRPGQTGEVTITVTDADGRPVQGEFSLAAVDEALYYIQADTAGDIRQYFHGDRRYSAYSMQHSRSTISWPLTRDRNRWHDHDVTGIPYLGYWGGWYGALDSLGYMDGFDDGRRGGRMDPATAAYRAPAKAAGDKMVLEESTIAGLVATTPMAGEMAPPPPLDTPGPQVRTEFRDTAHWEPVVITDSDGRATVEITWPDTLTTWDVVVRGIDGDSRVGGGNLAAVTTRDLLVRLLGPRFLVERDSLVITAVVDNRGDEAVEARVALDGPVDLVRFRGDLTEDVVVPAGGQVRVDFPIEVLRAGDAPFTASVVAEEDSDAVRQTFPVLTWGTVKTVAETAVLRDGGRQVMELAVPRDHREGSAVLTVHLSPSLASVMVDALPYLIDYPYGCVEQTMSRFLPAAITSQTLRDLGVDLSDLEGDRPGALGEQAEDLATNDNPVYDPRELDRAVRKGLARLLAFQHADGGWGWWKGGSSDPYMSAYVVAGMQTARDAGYAVDPGSLGRGYGYLRRQFEATAPDGEAAGWWSHRRVYIAYVLSLRGKLEPGDLDAEFDGRADLSNYGKALLALALHNAGDDARAALVVENLRDLARVDEASGTASFDFDDGGPWWSWYHDRVETNAWALRAFLAVAPDDELADPLARWLVNNRRGNRWHSTKDTATAILALSDYVRARGELDADYGLTVRLDGEEVLETRVTRANLFTLPTELVLQGDALAAGTHDLEIATSGKGSLYASAYLTYFTTEANIGASGHELAVQREYSLLTPTAGQDEVRRGTIDTLQFDRTPLRRGARVAAGDLVEVRLEVRSPNTYEYLVFEDFKPAGFESEELKSGYMYDNGTFFNRELRDEKVVFFLDRLRQGEQILTYRLRAETPGTFHVLPHSGHAMYAPRIAAISDSFQLKVVDRP